jgi:hypothetical protein
MLHYQSIPPCSNFHVHRPYILVSYTHVFLHSSPFKKKEKKKKTPSSVQYRKSVVYCTHCTYRTVHSTFCVLSPAILYLIFTRHYYYLRLWSFFLSFLLTKIFSSLLQHKMCLLYNVHCISPLYIPPTLPSHVYTLYWYSSLLINLERKATLSTNNHYDCTLYDYSLLLQQI